MEPVGLEPPGISKERIGRMFRTDHRTGVGVDGAKMKVSRLAQEADEFTGDFFIWSRMLSVVAWREENERLPGQVIEIGLVSLDGDATECERLNR
jgi:hypothetical protein